MLTNDFWGTPLSHSGSHKSYRPLCSLTFKLNTIWSGLNPYGFHLVNILLHCIATYLFTQLAKSQFSKSKSNYFLVLTYLKIWNTGIQELFTEFKKLFVVKFCAVANLARFAKCRKMYRISHIVEFGLKIQRGELFLGAG